MEDKDSGMAKAFAACLGGVLLLSMGASFLQWAGPILARSLAEFEAHLGAIVVIGLGVFVVYVWARVKLHRLRDRGRVHPGTVPSSVPAYAYHPGRDRPGLLGSVGRWLSERRGGPVIYDGGRPLHVFEARAVEVDDEEEVDEDEPGEGEHRYTAAEAKRIYQAVVAERRGARRRW